MTLRRLKLLLASANAEISLAALTVLLVASCNFQPWYKDGAAFRKEIDDWALGKRELSDALKSLQDKGFVCGPTQRNPAQYRCSRRAENFPCAQQQMVALDLDAEKKIVLAVTPSVLANGELPTACL